MSTMSLTLTILLILVSLLLSGLFATLTFSLRDFSRPRLADLLERRGRSDMLKPTVDNAGELAFITASIRLLFNVLILLGALHAVRDRGWPQWAEYLVGASFALLSTIIASVTIPHALAQYLAEPIISISVGPLHVMRIVCRPLTRMLRLVEGVIERASARPDDTPAKANEDIQSEILAVMEEGEKEGVVDEAEREMIESVITFRATAVVQVMTSRPDILGEPVDAGLEKFRGLMEESGHSRIPLYEGTLDHIVGILYARDLLKYIGEPIDKFDVRQVMRAPFFVPETKLLRDLLADFRLQKVHIAIVLDEYGGTAGLVTIEDVLEELVGEISDEHEPIEDAVFKRIDDNTADVDARIHVDELNRLLGTHLPDDAGFDTVGGFISTHLGRIPEAGTEFESDGASFHVIDAEPQRVGRVRVQLIP